MSAVQRRSWNRILWWTATGLVGAAIVAAMFAPKRIAVDVATVGRGGLRVTLDHEGKTRVRHRYMVSAPVGGRLLRIDLEPGTPVRAGDTVVATMKPTTPALLDPRNRAELRARVEAAQAGVRQAQGDLARIQAQRKYADAQRQRIEMLAKEGVTSLDELEAARSNAQALAESEDAGEGTFRAAQHELEAARAALMEPDASTAGGRALDVRAPVTGVVLQRLHESEAVVPAGEPLMDIADPADLEIVSDYLSTDAVQIRAGMPVEVDRWGGDKTLSGRVRVVEPHGFLKVSALGVEEQRVNVITRFDDPRDAWRALGDGYRVETRVVIWDRPDALKVPISSLFRQGDGWAVFVVQDGRARLQTIEVGRRGSLDAEVLKGLQEGATVVLHPPDTLSDNARVTVRSASRP